MASEIKVCEDFEGRALRAEIRAAEAEMEIKAHNAKIAEEAITAAVIRGAIPAQDFALHARFRAIISEDPGNVVLVDSLPGRPELTTQITQGVMRRVGA